tara:strand:- start:166 stop:537 length:372 start_codon:yes stop_codon:yes gene_type:complete
VVKKRKEKRKEKSVPEKVKIGYQDVLIEWSSASFSRPSDSYGEYDHRKNTISIQDELSNLDEANTLLHEILHGIVYINSLTVGGQPLDKEDKEEIVINQITNGLMQVFRDNKWLLDFLKEKIK